LKKFKILTNLALVTLAVFVLNLPFGYWRGQVKKFSLQWFLAVHLPVPAVIALRFAGGLGFQWFTYPFLVGAFFLGQFAGAKFAKRKRRAEQ
jgi:hypothetical protein